jgi:hypothetical protein
VTVIWDRPPLPEALGIPGARAVSLLDPDGPTTVWWAGVEEPGERQAAAVVAVAAAASGLVALADIGDELGDVILTSAEMFHVIRLVADGTGHVAHLTLNRAAANLAMARREFRLVVEGYAVRPRHAASPALPYPSPPRPALPRPSPPRPSLPRPSLPRRERGAPPGVADEVTEVPADWLSLITAPYSTDERVLDRILVTLRSL